MIASASTTSSGPRYAPDDPTLPKPWRGLVDGNTGYLYYWNPETNVTQYERPDGSSLPGPPPLPPPPPKSAPMPISSSIHVQEPKSSSGQGHQALNYKDDDTRHNVSSSSGLRHATIPGSRSHQGSRGCSGHTHNRANGLVNGGHGVMSTHKHSSGEQTSRSSTKMHGSTDMGGGSVDTYRCQHEVSVSGFDVPAPFMTFESTGFPSEILREVHQAGFSAPTPIQAQSWPIALQARDIVAIAKTGSGKTLGYLIPGFIHIKRCCNNPQKGPTVLVLSPTRELATQIQDEAVKFGRSSRISCTCLYGGAPKNPQIRDLDRGVDIVVATPGRLNDFLEMRKVSLRQVSYLVLDEADRMLDMGFEPQIRKIVKEIPARRQTLMYTATWPKEVRKIAADLLVKPVQVNIGSIDELVANKAITQYVEVITPMEKQRRLEQILQSQEPGSKVLIFCTTKRTCDQLARSIARQFGAQAIHGDKSQSERDWVLNQFRSGRSPILVATDVAARGLDIKDIRTFIELPYNFLHGIFLRANGMYWILAICIRVVINHDFPTGIEDYVHRIGRTGRAGATGVSYTFFCDQDAKYAKDLIKVLEGAGQRVPQEIRNMVMRGRGMGKSRRQWGGGKDVSRSHGVGRDDPIHAKAGRGLPLSSSGWSERARVGRGADHREPHDRYDRAHHEGHVVDARVRHDRGLPSEPSDRRDRGRGWSRSPSPLNRLHERVGRSRSRSRSRNRNHVHRRSSSRSHSHEKLGRGYAERGRSPRLMEDDSAAEKPVDHVHSPLPNQHWRSPRFDDEDVDVGIEPALSRSPPRVRAQSPYSSQERGSPQREEAAEPVNGGGGSQWDYGEEEEEGLIPPDEDGMNQVGEGIIPEAEDGQVSSKTMTQNSVLID